MATCSFVLRNVMCPVHHCNIFGDSINHHALDLRWVCLCGRGKCFHLRGTVSLCASFLVQAGGAFVWSIWTDVFIRWHGVDGLVSCCSHLSNLPLLLTKHLPPPPPAVELMDAFMSTTFTRENGS